MKGFLAFALVGSTAAQNSTQSLRSLLSPRAGVTLSDAPKIEGTYCGWSQHGESIHCRMDFKDGKMRLQYKRKGDGKKHDGCKDGVGPEHTCCRCEQSVGLDCKDISVKVSTFSTELTSGLDSDGYDVHFKSSCIESHMGKDSKNSNGVPLRIKIHDSGHMDLLECEQQNDKDCDGGGPRCDVVHNGPDGSGCDDWDGGHTPACRRRAGCHGPHPSPSPSPSDDRRRRSPSPSPSDDRRRRSGDDRRRSSPSPSPSKPCRRRAGCHSRGLPVPEAGPDEFEDDLKICSASCSAVNSCDECPAPDEDFD